MALDDDPDLPGRVPMDQGKIVVAAVLFEAGLAPLALVLGNFWGQDPFAMFAWNLRGLVDGALATVPMVLLLLAAIRWPIGPLARIMRVVNETIAPLLRGRPASDLALLAVAAGVGEELLFRGVIQGALAHRFGMGAGLALAATLFGFLHPITLAYVLIAGLLGAYLGAVWIASGNLLVVMVAHALYDFVALRLLLRDLPSPAAGET